MSPPPNFFEPVKVFRDLGFVSWIKSSNQIQNQESHLLEI